MSHVVITGSTRGIGRGLAVEFLRRGHHVVVTSRRSDDVARAVDELSADAPGRVAGVACDVTRKTDVQALWDHGVAAFGRIDIWINNAGRAISRHLVHQQPEADVHVLVDGNVKGTVFGSQVAIEGFRRQGHGALYNTLGGSFDGRRLTPNMGIYSATKAADWLLSKYLTEENRAAGIIVGMISPGMLITENWIEEQRHIDPAEWQKIRPVLNILCDDVETATPWLVEQILANRKTGRRIAWLSGGRIAARFLAARLPGRRRDLFSRHGI